MLNSIFFNSLLLSSSILLGLNRCRKSCRMRWLNYLRPDLKRGCFGKDEVDLTVRLHKLLGIRRVSTYHSSLIFDGWMQMVADSGQTSWAFGTPILISRNLGVVVLVVVLVPLPASPHQHRQTSNSNLFQHTTTSTTSLLQFINQT